MSYEVIFSPKSYKEIFLQMLIASNLPFYFYHVYDHHLVFHKYN